MVARRIFDLLTPGYAETGRVWLPLPHLLAAALALNDTLWRTGLADSLISTAAFAATGRLMFRLSCAMGASLAAGVMAMAAFLLSPNLLYVAAAPLTESLTMFWAPFAAYGLCRFQQGEWPVAAVGPAAFCRTLTRYDGWHEYTGWIPAPLFWRVPATVGDE